MSLFRTVVSVLLLLTCAFQAAGKPADGRTPGDIIYEFAVWEELQESREYERIILERIGDHEREVKKNTYFAMMAEKSFLRGALAERLYKKAVFDKTNAEFELAAFRLEVKEVQIKEDLLTLKLDSLKSAKPDLPSLAAAYRKFWEAHYNLQMARVATAINALNYQKEYYERLKETEQRGNTKLNSAIEAHFKVADLESTVDTERARAEIAKHAMDTAPTHE